MTNGPTYTEAVLEFTDRLNDSEKEILKHVAESERRQVDRLDAIATHNSKVMAALAKGDAKFTAIDDKLDGKGGVNERIAENTATGKVNAAGIVKVRNLNATITAAMSGLAAFIGLQK